MVKVMLKKGLYLSGRSVDADTFFIIWEIILCIYILLQYKLPHCVLLYVKPFSFQLLLVIAITLPK